ncbi:heavy metal translocating P-type ATPase [Anaerobranca gottschalkii]|uniref:Cd2+/Zn2+-exporting ATPase n=1 Tax=Anaerobranca gottschalkii DSM 13577 TaxID=1120990 RepID=A0A1I0B862_9FIRM|nr:heavy metal translocating P-type ATPase [Anaerobranca gottschalkii]SET02600.1 Cd2+/Zn2+-exporting ATPase [Anaerobranca gottschalkii DSM 13577]
MAKKIEFQLEGLNCASCATKIEEGIKEIDGIVGSQINFVNKVLKIELEDTKDFNEKIVDKVQELVDMIEPGIVVKEKEVKIEEHHHDLLGKNELIKIILGGGLFVLPIVFTWSNFLEFLIFFIAYILVGHEVLFKAGRNIVKGQVFDENFLMTLATLGAFAIGEFPEAVAVMLFYKVGEYIQGLAVDRSRKSIAELMDIRPDYANLKKGEDIERITPEEVQVGDLIIVKPGEKVPLDGIVIDGNSVLDTSALTGESLPKDISVGDEILSGSINISGVLTVKVTKEFNQSTLSKILDLVENASSKKAPTENFITKFARYYTPVVVGIALLISILPPLFLQGATFNDWIYRGLIFLVISCPCALVISIPLGFFGGIGGASKKGILVKGSNYLEGLNSVKVVVFDKTGTLTKGTFKVKEIVPQHPFTKEEILELAAIGEGFSNHPIALSILKEYGRTIDKNQIVDYQEVTGQGVKVQTEDKNLLIGNKKLMEMAGISYENVEELGTIVHIAVNGQYAGYILITDEIKKDAAKGIKGLKDLGVKKIIMLTGDNQQIGKKVAEEVGINEYYCELLPHHKVEIVENILKTLDKNSKLLFVGDGINDAPVLARADIGVAMGGVGSDAAIEAADIVIMNDQLNQIPLAIKIAKRTRNIVWQNIVFALGVKGLVLILGAFGLATIWEAVFADVGVTVIAVLNAVRVLKVKGL